MKTVLKEVSNNAGAQLPETLRDGHPRRPSTGAAPWRPHGAPIPGHCGTAPRPATPALAEHRGWWDWGQPPTCPP